MEEDTRQRTPDIRNQTKKTQQTSHTRYRINNIIYHPTSITHRSSGRAEYSTAHNSTPQNHDIRPRKNIAAIPASPPSHNCNTPSFPLQRTPQLPDPLQPNKIATPHPRPRKNNACSCTASIPASQNPLHNTAQTTTPPPVPHKTPAAKPGPCSTEPPP